MENDKVLTVIHQDGKTARGKEPRIGKEELLRLYGVMVTTRAMDERALAMQRQGKIGFYVPCTGQEASHVGSAYALSDSDWIFPSYRDAGILLLRGVPLVEIACQWIGNAGDVVKGRQMPVHYSFRSANFVSISSPIGTQISQAAGAAMAARIRGEETVVATYFGDGATSSNDFHAGLNFAAVFRAPCIFVCENNHWAISQPLDRQTGSETLAVKAEAYGMPGLRVDGNDVLAVYRATREAVDRARKGGGPTLIETVTFRMGPHSSSDDPTRYRDAKVVEAWAERDPIERFRRYLEKKGLLSADQAEAIDSEAKARVKAAVEEASRHSAPGAATLFEDVFRDLTPQLREQQQDLLSLEGPEPEEEGAFPL